MASLVGPGLAVDTYLEADGAMRIALLVNGERRTLHPGREVSCLTRALSDAMMKCFEHDSQRRAEARRAYLAHIESSTKVSPGKEDAFWRRAEELRQAWEAVKP